MEPEKGAPPTDSGAGRLTVLQFIQKAYCFLAIAIVLAVALAITLGFARTLIESMSNPNPYREPELIRSEFLAFSANTLSGLCLGTGAVLTAILTFFRNKRILTFAWLSVFAASTLGLFGGGLLFFGPSPQSRGCYSGMEAFGQHLIGIMMMGLMVFCFVTLGASLLILAPRKAHQKIGKAPEDQ